jgi:hypothetical protein
MFEILFLAFAIMALLRLPREVRCIRERKRSTLPSWPQYQISEPAADRAPRLRKPIRKDELTEIGSMSKWPSLRHANDNRPYL